MIALHYMSILASRGTYCLYILMIFFMMLLGDGLALIIIILVVIFFILVVQYIDKLPWMHLVLATSVAERREYNDLRNTVVSHWRG